MSVREDGWISSSSSLKNSLEEFSVPKMTMPQRDEVRVFWSEETNSGIFGAKKQSWGFRGFFGDDG